LGLGDPLLDFLDDIQIGKEKKMGTVKELKKYFCENGHPLVQYRGIRENLHCPICGAKMKKGERIKLPAPDNQPNFGAQGFFSLETWKRIKEWWEKTENETFPCGCVRGEFLCPEAVRLWGIVKEKYEESKITGNWRDYEKARQDYEDHFRKGGKNGLERICKENGV